MNPFITFIVSILYNNSLIECALKFPRDEVDESVIEYPMEPESRDVLHSMLPIHVASCGPIVGVKEIFDSHVIKKRISLTNEKEGCKNDR